MSNIINIIKNNISIEMWIIILAAIVVIIVTSILIARGKQNQAKKVFDDLELSYNTMKGIPLAFKLNKAQALTRVNDEMSEVVATCKSEFDEIQEELRECSVMLAEADDAVYLRKRKAFYELAEELRNRLAAALDRCNRVDASLDEVLEQESEQRVLINGLKEEFRAAKKNYTASRNQFNQTTEYLEQEITTIEKMFSDFEEWMFASEFHKAKDVQEEICDRIESLNELMSELPSINERVRGVLPHAIEEAGFAYAQAKDKGVHCEHLEVKKNLEIVTDMLANLVGQLRSGIINEAEDTIYDCTTRILQLREQLQSEEAAFDELQASFETSLYETKQVNRQMEEVKNLYNRVYERFGFENWSERLREADERLDALNELKRRVETLVADEALASTSILINYKEFAQGLNQFKSECDIMMEQLKDACSDEERAKKQLIKLQLIVNEMRGKITRFRLPNISDKYGQDLTKSIRMIDELELILSVSPLDVERLNSRLDDSIDYIYSLYNNVNNLIGMATMVENVIVFGNRYRSSYTEVDTELTRAELCFRNGEFTKALKISIQSIEKLHPGAYEKLVAGNRIEDISLGESL